MRITPETFVKQWNVLPHKFEVNLFNFKSAITRATVAAFHRNISNASWNGTPWPQRKRRASHPLLFETGSLKRSIKVKRLHQKSPKKITIHTDDEAPLYADRNTTDPHKWGQRPSKREYAFVYAAIHNEGGRIATPGSPASHIRQRKFMGENMTEVDRIAWLYIDRYLFQDFPK